MTINDFVKAIKEWSPNAEFKAVKDGEVYKSKGWLQKYEDAWYNGVIDTLHRPWDNDVLWYAVKDLPHRNLSKSVLKAPQGFEDTDLLDSFFHYSGKGRKHMVRQ